MQPSTPQTLASVPQRDTLTINVDAHTVLHYLEVATLLEVKAVKVYATRVSIEKRSKFGMREHRETYPISDFGDIYISKGRSRAVIGVHARNSSDKLFMIERLTHQQAERLKDVLDILLDARQQRFSSGRGS